jgi:hypothetical protein
MEVSHSPFERMKLVVSLHSTVKILGWGWSEGCCMSPHKSRGYRKSGPEREEGERSVNFWAPSSLCSWSGLDIFDPTLREQTQMRFPCP